MSVSVYVYVFGYARGVSGRGLCGRAGCYLPSCPDGWRRRTWRGVRVRRRLGVRDEGVPGRNASSAVEYGRAAGTRGCGMRVRCKVERRVLELSVFSKVELRRAYHSG